MTCVPLICTCITQFAVTVIDVLADPIGRGARVGDVDQPILGISTLRVGEALRPAHFHASGHVAVAIAATIVIKDVSLAPYGRTNFSCNCIY